METTWQGKRLANSQTGGKIEAEYAQFKGYPSAGNPTRPKAPMTHKSATEPKMFKTIRKLMPLKGVSGGKTSR